MALLRSSRVYFAYPPGAHAPGFNMSSLPRFTSQAPTCHRCCDLGRTGHHQLSFPAGDAHAQDRTAVEFEVIGGDAVREYDAIFWHQRFDHQLLVIGNLSEYQVGARVLADKRFTDGPGQVCVFPSRLLRTCDVRTTLLCNGLRHVEH